MTKKELLKIEPSIIVDARGTACPGPLLATKKAIERVLPGEVIEIMSSDTASKYEIPDWARQMHFQYLGTIEKSGYFRILVKI